MHVKPCCIVFIGGSVVTALDDVPTPPLTPTLVPAVVLGRQMPPITRCCVCLIGGEQQSGEISVHFASALRGCRRSGESARRSNGELGSALLVRTKPLFFEPLDMACTVGSELPGLYDCVVFEAPG